MLSPRFKAPSAANAGFSQSHLRNTIPGIALMEVLFAAACFVGCIVGIYALYSRSLQVAQSADQSAICSENLLQRAEQIRRTGWANATSPAYLSSTSVLGKQLDSTVTNLPGLVNEYVTLAAVALPYASPAPSPLPTPSATVKPFRVMRSGSTVTVSPSPADDMYSQSAVQLTLGITWRDQTGRQHNREMSTIISNAGLVK